MVETIFVIALVLVAVLLFASEKLPVELIALLLMTVLLVSGVLTPEEGIAGFSNPATVTVAAMFVLSAGVFKTGALNLVGAALVRLARWNLWAALVVIMAAAALPSAFVNNTPVVAIFLPLVLEAARRAKISPSKLLMPLSYASMLGGVCTLIGTSTNILVSSIAQRSGLPPFEMFEFTRLGLIFLAVGVGYMLLVGVRLIPDRRRAADLTGSFEMANYLTEIILLPEAKSVGARVGESPLEKEVEVDILEVYRDGRRLEQPLKDLVLAPYDVLRVRCNVAQIRALRERMGIALKSESGLRDHDLESEQTVLVEAVVAPNSPLSGKTFEQAGLRTVLGATPLAMRHRGALLHESLDSVPLQAGDALLLKLPRERLARPELRESFVVISQLDVPVFRKTKILPALAVVAGVVLVAALDVLPIVVSALLGCIVMVLAGCLTLEEAYQAIEWKVIFLLGGVLALGAALEKTGAALLLSKLLISTVGSFGPVAVVSALYLFTSVLTEAMSNNATAALLAPIAITTARGMNVNPRPFLMAVCYAASSSFMTPVGYQTNTMIYAPGQYRFADFLRVGAPLNTVLWILASILIPRFWPF